MISPARDPEFHNDRVHGELAQHRFMKAVLEHVPNRRIAIDCGAHIGLWTRALAQKFKYVVAFEPVDENFECLEQNAKLRNTQLERVALAGEPGACQMILPRGGNSGCWYAQPGIVGAKITMRTLDSYNFKDVDLIKIDVEGYEGDVLMGACATLTQSRPIVVFEVNGLGQKHYGPNWCDPTLALGSWGYKFIAKWGKNEIWVPR